MEEALKVFDLTMIDAYMIGVVSILFVFFWRAMERVLFKPYLKLIEAREKATVGAEEEATAAYTQAEVGEREYDAKILEARRSAMEKKLAVLAKAKIEADKIAHDATAESEKILAAARGEIRAEADTARTQLNDQAQSLANDLVAKLKQPPLIFVLTLILSLSLSPQTAFAAGGDGHSVGVSALFLPAVNFILYLFIITKLTKKPILAALHARKENMESHIKRAATSWEQAKRQLLDVQRRFNSLDKDIKEIEERIAREGTQEAAAIVQDAKEKGAALIKRTKEGAEAERRAVELALRNELAQEVLQIASNKLSKEISSESDRPLRDRALEGIRAIG